MSEVHNIQMPRRVEDLTGQRFGRWVVLSYAGPGKWRKSRWLCRCDCGTERKISGNLKSGATVSCGCLRIEKTTKHGMYGSPEYNVWRAMNQRCQNPRSPCRRHYGGRGITVCPQWQRSFLQFMKDMGPRPYPKATLERINNDGNYTPENCCWASMRQQARNQRGNRLITHNGETHCVMRWTEIIGMNCSTLYNRLNLGWSPERALTEPVRPLRKRCRSPLNITPSYSR